MTLPAIMSMNNSVIVYCRFGNNRGNFIFANHIKRHISDVFVLFV